VLGNIFSVAWIRSDVYTQSPVGKSTSDLALLPQCKQFVWNLANIEKPEFFTSITSTGNSGEGNWLSTSALPTVSPNTGSMFDPTLYVTVGNMYASQAALGLMVEEEVVIECRGSKK